MTSPRRPSLEGLTQWIMERVRRELRTGIPAVVQSYDDSTQEAVVEPAIRAKDVQGRPANKAPLKVPVAWMRGGGWVIQGGLDEGDTVHLDVMDRDTSRWHQGDGSAVDQERTDAHNLRNSVVRPDLYPRSDPLPPANGSLRIARITGEASIRLDQDGTIEVCSKGSTRITITPAGQVEIDTGGPLKFVARDGDSVNRTAAFETWQQAVSLAAGAPALPPGPIGTVAASSTTVRSS